MAFILGSHKASDLTFTTVSQPCPDLPFAPVPELCGGDPFPMEEQFPFGSQADDIILMKGIKLLEDFIFVISPVHGESRFSKERRATFQCGKRDIVDGCEILFRGGMDLGEDADWQPVSHEGTGLSHMVAFFINAFGSGNAVDHVSSELAVRFSKVLLW